MRAGVWTVQQALTAEVATVLKHSLNLARRRGHAQVTPLHVAATLMSSSSASSDLLRRACLKSQPHHPAASHTLQCRALELCFNVALNRLPTTSPPSSGLLLPPPSSLSNSLIAALKRAQANQRRGCIELQQQQQQQPLLTIKVEMEQLMLSILDDPSVSRVMKEAGFSSSCVKNFLEEESSLSQSSPFLLDSSNLLPPLAPPPSMNEDLRMVVEVMTRKERKRSNIVVVGDSNSMREGLVAELMMRVERGGVPDELKHASFINLQFSQIHLRLMSKADVDSKVFDLRRTINSLASGGVIIYAGDLRWAVDEEARREEGEFNPVEHIVAEMGNLLSELRSSKNGGTKVWLLATASYQTYIKCQMRQPCLETQWALQAVGVPCGWLALSLQASSELDSRVSRFGHFPSQLLESRIQSSKEDEKLSCCDECAFIFEKEALLLKSESSCWQQARPESNHKEILLDLRRKWNKLCRSLHHSSQTHLYPPLLKNYSKSLSNSWWPSSLVSNQSNSFLESHLVSVSVPATNRNAGFSITAVDKKTKAGNSHESYNSLKMSANEQLKTSLALSSLLFSDSATSKDQTRVLIADMVGLQKQLQEEIPWQSNTIPSIMEALYECVNSDKKTIRLLIQGSDHIAKRKLALLMADSFFGSTDKLVHVNQTTLSNKGKSCLEILIDALRKDQKCVFLIEDIDRMPVNFIESFKESLKVGCFEDKFGGEVSLGDAIFILTTSKSTKFKDDDCNSNSVVMMRLQVEYQSTCDAKRKSPEPASELQNRLKKARTSDHSFDLNFQANEESDEEEAVPSDLTHETDCISLHLPHKLLESTVQLTLDAGSDQFEEVKANLLVKLHRSFNEIQSAKDETGQLLIDPVVAEQLMKASGSFLGGFFESWAREVFRASLLNVRMGGKLRLSLEGKERNIEEFGYMSSVLPKTIHVV
ncbi:protein SMAX1-LIKE 4-like [Canna indica]|uniref:Protein SMAX1-LIKE 4-like n=1 Tax=Canna indica TaxID=4628 RepID=A0AAQ3KM68_9LILI|nr:protein SMAX1-LIKE 4-like [Canna indica]